MPRFCFPLECPCWFNPLCGRSTFAHWRETVYIGATADCHSCHVTHQTSVNFWRSITRLPLPPLACGFYSLILWNIDVIACSKYPNAFRLVLNIQIVPILTKRYVDKMIRNYRNYIFYEMIVTTFAFLLKFSVVLIRLQKDSRNTFCVCSRFY